MPKKSNNNKDIMRGDRTRQNKDEFGVKSSHMNAATASALPRRFKRSGKRQGRK